MTRGIVTIELEFFLVAISLGLRYIATYAPATKATGATKPQRADTEYIMYKTLSHMKLGIKRCHSIISQPDFTHLSAWALFRKDSKAKGLGVTKSSKS